MGRKRCFLAILFLTLLVMETVGVCPTRGAVRWALTHRVFSYTTIFGGGVRVESESGYGGQLHFWYQREPDSKITILEPVVTYHFKRFEKTIPFIGLGYYLKSDEYDETKREESGITLLGGLEYFVNKHFSLDLRIVGRFLNSDGKGKTQIGTDLGVSIFF